jgi:transporter family-2 protein
VGAWLSLTVSVAVIVPLLLAVKAPSPNVSAALHGPGGCGWAGCWARCTGSATVLTPKLGAGGFLVAVVAGQMVTAVLVDHYGLMGLTPGPSTPCVCWACC